MERYIRAMEKVVIANVVKYKNSYETGRGICLMKRKAIIIGAGPAGLTAAYYLLKKTDILPIVLEESDFIGGISRTAEYKGNRIDIGGHRFFSKSIEFSKGTS